MMIISVGVYGFWSRKLPQAVKAPGSAKHRRRRSVAGFCPMDRTRAGSRGGRAAAAGSHAPPGVAQGSAHASAASWAPSPGLSGHQPWDPPDLLVAEPERPPASPAGHGSASASSWRWTSRAFQPGGGRAGSTSGTRILGAVCGRRGAPQSAPCRRALSPRGWRLREEVSRRQEEVHLLQINYWSVKNSRMDQCYRRMDSY